MTKKTIAEPPADQVVKLCEQYLTDKNLKGSVSRWYHSRTAYKDMVIVLVLGIDSARLEAIKKDLQIFARFTEHSVDRPGNIPTVGIVEVYQGYENMAKYPSQDEAQMVLDTLVALEGIYIGGAQDTNTARYIPQWREEALAEFAAIFDSPDSSPWEATLERGKLVLAHREHWVCPSTILRKPKEDEKLQWDLKQSGIKEE